MKRKKFKKNEDDCPLVAIDWEDSRQTCGKWRLLTDVVASPAAICQTAGWLIREDKDTVSIAQSVGDVKQDGFFQCSGVMVITNSAIKQIRRLR